MHSHIRCIILTYLPLLLVSLNSASEPTPDPSRLIISFYEDPRTEENWEIREGVLVTHMSGIDSLNRTYNVNSYEKIFRHPNLRRHIVFLRSDTTGNIASISAEYTTENEIELAHPDYPVSPLVIPNDPEYNNNILSMRAGIDMFRAWELRTGDPSVIVGIVDFGIHYDNSQLSPAIWVNPGEDIDGDGEVYDSDDFNGIDDDSNGYVDDLIGWNSYLDSGEITFNAHGTWVSSAVAAQTNDTTDALGIAGGWYPNQASVKFAMGQVSYSGQGGGLSHILPALEYLGTFVNVINMSLQAGYGNVDVPTWVDIIEEVILPNNVVLVAGAGNNDSSIVVAPANSAYVIAVAATDPIASGIFKASFSNYGANVDIAAPGVDWISCNGEGGTWEVSGTSISSPIVAAVAALVRGMDPTLDRNQIKAMLLDNTRPIDDPEYGDMLGSGQLDAYKTLSAVFSPNAPIIQFDPPDQGHPVIVWSTPEQDVVTIIVQRKVVTNDRYREVVESWTQIISLSGNETSYTDLLFGIVPDGPLIAMYRIKFIDHAQLSSLYSNTIDTEGYLGLPKLSNINQRSAESIPLPFPAGYPAMILYNDYLYMSDFFQGLYTVSFTGIDQMAFTDSIIIDDQEWCEQMATSSGYLYAFHGSNIHAYDLTEPAHPELIDHDYTTSTIAYNIDVRDSLVYIGGIHPYGGEDYWNTFEIVSFANPSEPDLLYLLEELRGHDGVQVSHQYPHYVVLSGYPHPEVFDVSDPSNPDLVYSSGSRLHYVKQWNDVFVGLDGGTIEIWVLSADGSFTQTGYLVEEVFTIMTAEGEILAGAKDSEVVLFHWNDGDPIEVSRITISQDIRSLTLDDTRLVVCTSDSLHAFILPEVNTQPEIDIPTKFHLINLYPNPFNSTAQVEFTLDEYSVTTLQLFDVLGREVMTLHHGELPAGRHQFSWDASGLASGIYFVKLNAGVNTAITKAVLLR